MKSFLNSSLIFIVLFLVCNLFLSSCHKDKNDPAPASIPLVATILNYTIDGVLSSSTTFQYDNQNRLIKIIDDNDYYSTLEYSESMVIMIFYNNANVIETTNIRLNDSGFGTSVTYGDSNEKETYEYDSNGYNKSRISEGDTGVHTLTYTVSDLNYVTIISEEKSKTLNSTTVKEFKNSTLLTNLGNRFAPENKMKSAVTDYTVKSEYLFYKDKINTIDYENWGISFFGRQNKNPIKQSTSTTLNGGSNIEFTDIRNYTYEYDAKGKITKKIADDGNYSVYTYVD